VLAEPTRLLIAKARREQRFRPRAARINATVIEADVKYRTDAGLAAHGVRALARAGKKLAAKGRRANDGGQGSLALDGAQAAGDLAHDPSALGRGQGRGARADRADRRAAATHGQGSQADGRQGQGQGTRARREGQAAGGHQARRARKGKLGKPHEFGYVAQLCEVTPNTKRGARGFILPAATAQGNPGENTLLAQTASELQRLGLCPREVALDGGFQTGPTAETLKSLGPERTFISGRQQPGSRRTQRRLQRYRTGAEGRISHLKRGYGLSRSRLKGDQGQRIWTGWATLTYNFDTYTRLA